jgi:hypothetical protein
LQPVKYPLNQVYDLGLVYLSLLLLEIRIRVKGQSLDIIPRSNFSILSFAECNPTFR